MSRLVCSYLKMCLGEKGLQMQFFQRRMWKVLFESLKTENTLSSWSWHVSWVRSHSQTALPMAYETFLQFIFESVVNKVTKFSLLDNNVLFIYMNTCIRHAG